MAFSIWIFVTCQIQTGNQYLSIFVCLTTESSVSFDMKNLKGTRSGYRDSLWNILRHYSIPSQLVHLINCKSFYNNFRCSVGHNNFNVKTGVRQGCVTSALLLNLVIDWVMRKTTENSQREFRWGLFSTLEDLNFADDLVLLSHIHLHNQEKNNRLQADGQQVGLRIRTKKTETMTLMWKCLLMVRSGNKNYTR